MMRFFKDFDSNLRSPADLENFNAFSEAKINFVLGLLLYVMLELDLTKF